MSGSYCIAGTRIPVTAIKAFALGGYRNSEIMREYPTLNNEQIEAAIWFRVKSHE
jgi:uncharacterized protein (DUF433 family)